MMQRPVIDHVLYAQTSRYNKELLRTKKNLYNAVIVVLTEPFKRHEHILRVNTYKLWIFS